MRRAGSKVDWKRQYKIRSNWDRGRAKFHEVEVANPPTPPVLARVHKGLVFTVDSKSGLRVWSRASESKCPRAQTDLQSSVKPTSLAIDEHQGGVNAVVGLQDGRFMVYSLTNGSKLTLQLEQKANSNAAITSVALAMPYTVTMSSDRHIHLYQIVEEHDERRQMWSAILLTTLHASSPLQPACLGLRLAPATIVATISYAFNRLSVGWCLGLQEIRLNTVHGKMESRLTSSIETPLDAEYRGGARWEITSRSAFSAPSSSPFMSQAQFKRAPTSLSYSHPYLLASLADNTIMSYIVTSNDKSLGISSGKRLWGHTSAISGAEVSSRGKAVSVSAKGEEIRVWELEDALTTAARGRPSTKIQPKHPALDVVAAVARRGSGLGLALKEMRRELSFTRRWVGFDDEQVVVMGERDDRQIMACYDFT